MRPAGFFITTALILTATGCGGSDDPPTPTPAAPRQATVEIREYRYAPPTLTVARGARVTFTNHDASPHTATAQGGFDTGTLERGDSRRVTADRAGTYRYICALHPFMHATLVVR